MPIPNSTSALKHFTLWGLQQGLFSDRGETSIEPGGSVANSNLLFVDGVIRPRPGLDLFKAPPVNSRPITHISQHWPYAPNTPASIVVQQQGTNLRVYKDSGSGWDNIAPGGVFTDGTEANDSPQSCNFEGAWFFAGGSTDLAYLKTGDTVMRYVDQDQPDVALQPPDKPKVIAAFSDRIFLGNCINPDTGVRTPGYIAWCDHMRTNVWGGGVGGGTSGSTQLPVEAQPIIAFHCWSDVITAFQPRTISRGRFAGGQKTFAFDLVADGPGCISADTLVRWKEGKFLWMGPGNVYISRANELPVAIADSIKKRLRETVDFANIHKAMAFCDRSNDLYWLVLPKLGDSSLRKIFCCNLRTTGWFEGELNTQYTPSAAGEFVRSNGVTSQLIGDEYGNLLDFNFSHFSDNGQPFTCFWESGTFSGEQLSKGQSQQVLVERARAFSATSGGNVSLSVKTCDTLDEWTETSFGTQEFGVGEEENVNYERSESGEFFRFRFAFNSVAAAAHIQGISLSLIFGGDTK